MFKQFMLILLLSVYTYAYDCSPTLYKEVESAGFRAVVYEELKEIGYINLQLITKDKILLFDYETFFLIDTEDIFIEYESKDNSHITLIKKEIKSKKDSFSLVYTTNELIVFFICR